MGREDDRLDGTRIISAAHIRDVADISTVITAVESAFRNYAEGEAIMPPKSYIELSDVNGDFRSMPAHVGNGTGVKWVNVHPDNPRRFGLPTVMGLVIYSDPETAYPLAVLDGTELTRLRTGAAAGVATRHLASPDACSLGLVGAGVQSRTQLAAISTVVDLDCVVVTDVNTDAVEDFIQKESHRAVDITSGTPEEVGRCDIISTTTPSNEPIMDAEWVQPGTHINAIGADAAGKQELDPDILQQANVVVDDWEQCSHSGEINVAVADGSFTRDDVAAEIGEVVVEEPANLRESTTVFDSTGLAIQDIATAEQLYETASANDCGDIVEIVDGL